MGCEIDAEKLRQDLMDYFGTAMTSGFPMAMMDLSKIERASAQELTDIAAANGIDVRKYVI